MDNNRQLLTIPEVAACLALKESTVRAWLLRRRLAKVRIGARAIRVPASEVERIVSEGTIPAQVERR